MARGGSKNETRVRAAVVVLLLLGSLGFAIVSGSASGNTPATARPEPEPTPRRAPRRQGARPETKPTPSFKEFPHDRPEHKKDCASCHTFPSSNWEKVRKAEDAFPDITDYPKHDSCVSCHRQQFFKGAQPNICSICHTNPSPNDSSRHPFANPREIFDLSPKGKTAESDFKVRFPHDKHMGLLASAETSVPERTSGPSARAEGFRTQETNVCATCHSTINPQGDGAEEFYTKPPADLGDGFWLKRGTFKSSPVGHTQCFSCHSADSGLPPAPTDCATCHQFKEKNPPMDLVPTLVSTMKIEDKATILAWRKRASSAKFQHEFFAHNELSCSTCHNTDTMDTATAVGRKVKVMSCGGEGVGCHITPTSDDGGILNFELDERKAKPIFECTKCHIGFGKQAVPQSHIDAVKALGAKQ